MGAYRNLIDGVLFFLCSIVGLVAGVVVPGLLIPELRYSPKAFAIGAVSGALFGGVVWKLFRAALSNIL